MLLLLSKKIYLARNSVTMLFPSYRFTVGDKYYVDLICTYVVLKQLQERASVFNVKTRYRLIYYSKLNKKFYGDEARANMS